MSLDPLLVGAAATVGPAAALVLWTGLRSRHSARAFRTARRLLGGALLLALLLAAVATFRWSHATMGATAGPGPAPAPTRPPLVGFLLLAGPAGAALALAPRRRSGAASRLDIRRPRRLEQRPPLGLVGGHAVPVPGARGPAGGAVVTPTVPAGRCERSAGDARVGAEHLA